MPTKELNSLTAWAFLSRKYKMIFPNSTLEWRVWAFSELCSKPSATPASCGTVMSANEWCTVKSMVKSRAFGLASSWCWSWTASVRMRWRRRVSFSSAETLVVLWGLRFSLGTPRSDFSMIDEHGVELVWRGLARNIPDWSALLRFIGWFLFAAWQKFDEQGVLLNQQNARSLQ